MTVCLVDTNILVYSEDQNSPFYQSSKEFLETNLPAGNLAIAHQNLVEFYAIMTDPKRVTRAKKPENVAEKIEKWQNSGFYTVILPKLQTSLTATRLLRAYKIVGQQVFDVFLAATAIDNGIDTIYTADPKIFRRLGLKAINPLDKLKIK